MSNDTLFNYICELRYNIISNQKLIFFRKKRQENIQAKHEDFSQFIISRRIKNFFDRVITAVGCYFLLQDSLLVNVVKL